MLKILNICSLLNEHKLPKNIPIGIRKKSSNSMCIYRQKKKTDILSYRSLSGLLAQYKILCFQSSQIFYMRKHLYPFLRPSLAFSHVPLSVTLKKRSSSSSSFWLVLRDTTSHFHKKKIVHQRFYNLIKFNIENIKSIKGRPWCVNSQFNYIIGMK